MADVSVALRPPRWCPSEGHQHGVSIQSSVNLGETLFRITRDMKNRTDLNLGEVVCLSIIYGYDIYFRCKPGGGGTPLYGLYRYVRPQRVRFFSRFGHK